MLHTAGFIFLKENWPEIQSRHPHLQTAAWYEPKVAVITATGKEPGSRSYPLTPYNFTLAGHYCNPLTPQAITALELAVFEGWYRWKNLEDQEKTAVE